MKKYYFIIEFENGSCAFCDGYDTLQECTEDANFYMARSENVVNVEVHEMN